MSIEFVLPSLLREEVFDIAQNMMVAQNKFHRNNGGGGRTVMSARKYILSFGTYCTVAIFNL